MNKWLDLFLNLGLALLTLGIFVYAMLALKIWSSEYQLWFFRAGDYGSVLMISVGVIVIGFVLKKLLTWEIHSALGPKRRRKI